MNELYYDNILYRFTFGSESPPHGRIYQMLVVQFMYFMLNAKSMETCLYFHTYYYIQYIHIKVEWMSEWTRAGRFPNDIIAWIFTHTKYNFCQTYTNTNAIINTRTQTHCSLTHNGGKKITATTTTNKRNKRAFRLSKFRIFIYFFFLLPNRVVPARIWSNNNPDEFEFDFKLWIYSFFFFIYLFSTVKCLKLNWTFK